MYIYIYIVICLRIEHAIHATHVCIPLTHPRTRKSCTYEHHLVLHTQPPTPIPHPHPQTHTHMPTHTHARTHTHTFHRQAQLGITHKHTHSNTHTHTHIHTRTHPPTHSQHTNTHTHTHTHAHTHTRTHTHTHTHPPCTDKRHLVFTKQVAASTKAGGNVFDIIFSIPPPVTAPFPVPLSGAGDSGGRN